MQKLDINEILQKTGLGKLLKKGTRTIKVPSKTDSCEHEM
jgi:hypothetical protein